MVRVVLGGLVAAALGCGKLLFDERGPDASSGADTGSSACAPLAGCVALACGGRCYQLCTTPASWTASHAACRAAGGCLAEDTPADGLCLGLALADRGLPFAWVGFVQEPTATEFGAGWSTACSQVPRAPPWASGQPNDGGDGMENHDQDCAALASPNGLHEDGECVQDYPFLCQLP